MTRPVCSVASYTEEPIAPMFAEASVNCAFDISWIPFLLLDATIYPSNERRKSGTYV